MDVTRVSSGPLLPAAPGAGQPKRVEQAGRPPAEDAPTRAGEPQAPEPDAATLEEVASRLEAYLRSVGRSLEFRVDPHTNRTVITVRDAATGEVIRQIPSEEALRLARRLDDETVVLTREHLLAREE